MSWLHSPILGTGPRTSPRPLTAAAIRCARIRYARATEPARWIIAAMVLGKLLWFASVLLGIAVARPGAGPRSLTIPIDLTTILPGRVVTGLTVLTVFAFFVAVFPLVPRRTFDRNIHQLNSYTQSRARKIQRAMPKVFRALAAVFCIAALVLGLTLGWWATLTFASMLAAVLGTVAIATGITKRAGTHLTCARCGYPMGSWRGAAESCPECGSNWRGPWGCTTGARQVSWRWICAGLIAVIVGMTAPVVTIAITIP